MDAALPAALLKEGFLLLVNVGGPLFGVLFGMGLLMGVLQAATQINDPAVGFLPRVGGALLLCWFAGGWMMERLSGFLATALTRMAGH
ncbi:flagellar biosynthetic protein FliQ [Anaeromyxobacter paludicola]|uniref:Flagellar biosynthetic protein FliQ n=1 Tax=Anaeromyxobacter paludicola TaxID=2918171 RepID=A0ABN6N7N0_9BACT|nr:flagellar biosynthetic protein FliQ [Anaeromyxobacter paludicola]BDG07995.1 hypothetical protein AMPC_11080 [Anaeromyxobacter paludicola]